MTEFINSLSAPACTFITPEIAMCRQTGCEKEAAHGNNAGPAHDICTAITGSKEITRTSVPLTEGLVTHDAIDGVT